VQPGDQCSTGQCCGDLVCAADLTTFNTYCAAPVGHACGPTDGGSSTPCDYKLQCKNGACCKTSALDINFSLYAPATAPCSNDGECCAGLVCRPYAGTPICCLGPGAPCPTPANGNPPCCSASCQGGACQ
jgi:hypothetical protein